MWERERERLKGEAEIVPREVYKKHEGTTEFTFFSI